MWYLVLAVLCVAIGLAVGAALRRRGDAAVIWFSGSSGNGRPMLDLLVEVQGDSGEVIALKGTAQLPITSMNVESSVQLQEDELTITGLSDDVIPVIDYTAAIRNLDPQIVQSGSDTDIEADLFADGELVEAYDAANWDLTIDSDGSGGAVLGGVDGDDLTVGASIGAVVIRATYNNALDPQHDGNGTTITATTNVVAAVTNDLELYGPPSDVVENTSYQLFARSRDGVTGEVINDPEPGVAFAVTAGPATITGASSDILTVDAAITPPVTITVSASKTGFTPDSVNFNGIDPVTFPNNEPPGLSGIEAIDGSTKLFTGWTEDADWLDNNRVVVVADAAAKFASSAVEKRFFSGNDGWNGRTFHNIGNWTELYVRLVFLLSGNYQFVGSGGIFVQYSAAQGTRDFGLGFSESHGGRPAWIDWTSSLGEYVPVDGAGNIIPALTKNVYHTLEIYHGASITAGTGFLRFWLDNVEYTTFEKSFSGGSQGPLTGQTWQATNGTDKRIGKTLEAFLKLNSSKAVNDHVRISEIFVSGKS